MSGEHIPINRVGDIRLPLVKLLTGRGFVTGKSGSGKSNSVNVIVEETLDLGRPLLIIDTDGEYWGLKEQYSMLHLGTDDRCDATVTAADAETVVDVALGQGVPTILDISGFLREEDAEELVQRVVQHLFAREKELKEPFLLVVEEVHEYIPEKGGMSDVGETLIQVAKRGRKHGLGFIGVSQRPASVDKDFITQCDWIVWHRLTWKNDTEVVRTLLGSDAAGTVEGLDPGEALLMTDWDEQVQQVQFREKRTYDAGATPGFGETNPPDLVPINQAVLDRFGATGGVSEEEIEAALETRGPPDEESGSGTDATEDTEDPDEDELESADDDEDADGPTDDEPLAVDDDEDPLVSGDAGGELDTTAAESEVVADTSSVEPTPARTEPSTTPAARSRRTRPTTHRRRPKPPEDQPVLVEFGQMVIYVSAQVGAGLRRAGGTATDVVRGLLDRWLGAGNVSDDDVLVVAWLLLVVLFVAVVAVLLVVAT